MNFINAGSTAESMESESGFRVIGCNLTLSWAPKSSRDAPEAGYDDCLKHH